MKCHFTGQVTSTPWSSLGNWHFVGLGGFPEVVRKDMLTIVDCWVKFLVLKLKTAFWNDVHWHMDLFLLYYWSLDSVLYSKFYSLPDIKLRSLPRREKRKAPMDLNLGLRLTCPYLKIYFKEQQKHIIIGFYWMHI